MDRPRHTGKESYLGEVFVLGEEQRAVYRPAQDTQRAPGGDNLTASALLRGPTGPVGVQGGGVEGAGEKSATVLSFVKEHGTVYRPGHGKRS